MSFTISKTVYFAFLTALLLLLLPACGSEEQSLPKNVQPVKLEFFEVYFLSELESQWEMACNEQEKSDTANLSGSVGKVDYLRNMVMFPEAMNTGGVFGKVSKSNKEKVTALLQSPEIKSKFPKDVAFLWSADPTMDGKFILYAVKIPEKGTSSLTGKDVKEVEIVTDEYTDGPILSITMTSKGSHKWELLTARNVQRAIAITIDRQVMTAPIVNEPIAGGKVWISGSFTVEEAENLAMAIKAGSR